MQTIHPARPDQAPALAAIARAAYQKYLTRMDNPPAPMHADFPAHLARDTCFIAQQKATPVGYAILTQDSGGQWWLENLAVHPAAQGQGIGGALIDHIESWLKPRTPAYHLYTHITMTENLALYKKRGFIETRRAETDGHHRIYLTKHLTPHGV